MPRRLLSAFALPVVFVLLLFVVPGSPLDPNQSFGEDSAEEGFKPAFNGKDLTGWVAVNTAPSTWKMQDWILVCLGKLIGELRTLHVLEFCHGT